MFTVLCNTHILLHRLQPARSVFTGSVLALCTHGLLWTRIMAALSHGSTWLLHLPKYEYVHKRKYFTFITHKEVKFSKQ
jgi:hypothetical protein